MKTIAKIIKFWVPASIVIAVIHGIATVVCKSVIEGMRNTGDTVLAKDTFSAEISPYIITISAFIFALCIFFEYSKDKL